MLIVPLCFLFLLPQAFLFVLLLLHYNLHMEKCTGPTCSAQGLPLVEHVPLISTWAKKPNITSTPETPFLSPLPVTTTSPELTTILA